MIERNIEPGILKVLDCFQTEIDKASGYGKKLVIINSIQDNFYYDLVCPYAQEHNKSDRAASESDVPIDDY